MLHEQFKIVDLTQPLYANTPTWGGGCGYCLKVKPNNDPRFKNHQIEMEAGVGTHMDAPCHMIKGGNSIEKIPLEQLIAPACIIDISKKAHADYEISVDDIKNYEKAYGTIKKGSAVIGYTGWSRFWLDPKAYRNADAHGQVHFPAFSASAVALLIERDIAGIAIDTLSPDCLDHTYPVHQMILGAGKYIIENIGDCSQIPPKGAFLIALPIKIEGGTEAPLRAACLVPRG